MCGIAGVWAFDGAADDALRERAVAMANALRHRGPDGDGVFVENGLAFGFRRLAIIDLTEAGAQPMESASGRYVIVFNGEVFNHVCLRDELRAQTYRGHSDTEVILACIEEWGVERAVERFVGMFAFALWDRQQRTLTLVRDRLGVKPLYYRASANEFAFASELKALDKGTIDRGALALYARYGYVPAPWSIYEGVKKLPPGSMLTIDANGKTRMHVYWDAARVAQRAAAEPFRGTEEEALDALESLLADSVRLRLISDVPLGLFLSGGIDSPLVAAMMMREAGSVSTFTIGWSDMPSETPFASAIAKHLGTRHTEWIIDTRDVLATVPRMAEIYDEPLGDSSAIPTYLVSKLARQHVTVALSGDGGDELFGGYHRYFLGERLAQRVARVPRGLRHSVGTALRAAGRLSARRNVRDRLRGLGSALMLDDPIASFEQEVGPDTLQVLDAEPRACALNARDEWPSFDTPTELIMFLDAISYLPDDLLAKVDRASMAVSLEAREPLLDHRLVELAWSLPMSMKIADGQGKRILRRLLARYVPAHMVERDKEGFGLPVDGWLHGPLRAWAESLSGESRIRREGFFDPASVRALWEVGNEGLLWRLLMFQQWLDAH
ncbi:MAG TPA: asparagine synthase (glutamine-hydrolyzing) [Thermoanaerobaculia bacterium]|nr:asparagine synthase (glutamine-hydrolyzing) [Thermoanaerobaculia bacterium]